MVQRQGGERRGRSWDGRKLRIKRIRRGGEAQVPERECGGSIRRGIGESEGSTPWIELSVRIGERLGFCVSKIICLEMKEIK